MLNPILLVEDDPRDLELTLLALERSQLANEVIVARDGEEALAYLRREGQWSTRMPGNPAVVLLDLKLPKLDGIEVLAAIRRDDALKDVRVAILTSSMEESDVVRGYNIGANAFVVKPVNFNAFMKAVAELGFFWAVLNESPRSKAGVRHEPSDRSG